MGVAYHAHYLVWCDVARTDFIRALGMPYAELERNGIYLVVAEASIRYLAPARYDDLIQVDAWLERAQSRAVMFGYEIARASESGMQRLATATTKLIALDRGGSPCRLPTPLLRTFGEALLERSD
jgi:acyl-CoA thioester hydrolase